MYIKHLLRIFIALSASAMVHGEQFCPLPGNTITYYPDYTNCSRFIECYQGVETLMSCPDKLYWNQQLTTCDYPENVDCKLDPTATTPSTTTTTPAPTPSGWTPDPNCPYPSSIITYDYYPGDCAKFYECDHGIRYTFSCSNGLLWNHIRNYCDYPENVDCSRGLSTTSK